MRKYLPFFEMRYFPDSILVFVDVTLFRPSGQGRFEFLPPANSKFSVSLRAIDPFFWFTSKVQPHVPSPPLCVDDLDSETPLRLFHEFLPNGGES